MASTKKPHILFLVLDTHRADRMPIYGYHKDTTPVLGELAERATIFDWAIAPAQWTIPSHASMFTGLYPTVHQTNQSYVTLPEGIPTLAELLRENGYETIGFCNNPLISLLDNGLDRGFNQFFNYSGTFPDVPTIGDADFLQHIQQEGAKLLQRISIPIERQFGRSPLLLKLAMMPIFVPIWTRMTKFKGDTKRSLADLADYLHHHHNSHPDRPLFVFINMMETHLPYHPPGKTLDRWAPYMKKDREARDFLHRFNTETYRWIAPIIEPFKEAETATLRDVYDAEIAYQDQELHRIFRTLKDHDQLENTMVIVVSDHGESQGEHHFMGHAFAIYNELVRVPLFIRYPEIFPEQHRVEHAVSARRLFHTVLEVAGIEHEAYGHSVKELSLTRAVEGPDHEAADEIVASEAYPPLNFLNVIEMNNPEAVEPFRIRKIRRTLYQGCCKLMTVGDNPDEFFDVHADPQETNNLIDQPIGYENDLLQMQNKLDRFVVMAEAYRDGIAAGKRIDFSDSPELLERLRGLGYIE